MEITTMLTMLGEGFLVTLQIFFLTLIGSLPLGIVVALGRMSRFKPLALIVRFYISVMRGTPLMLQMFAIYFAPYYVFGIELTTDSKFNATIIAFMGLRTKSWTRFTRPEGGPHV
ncbi:ABC transporter permease subunit [Slackia equolifaciens]|uniref:ABC transporter permease subunit n=1 Tax=Slackia equolifaciens TaxID=498718 RepID=UPI001FE9DE9B|nr:ABC transporter permease subunit [Slackia equolifaciens]